MCIRDRTRNFILYLLVQFVLQFIPNIIVSCKADKEYPYLKECKELPEREEFFGILRNIGAMSFHKLGTVIVRNTDSLLMSSFVGLLSVGIYSNYKLVLSGINNLMDKFSNAFTGSLGNLGAIEDETRVYGIYPVSYTHLGVGWITWHSHKHGGCSGCSGGCDCGGSCSSCKGGCH